MKKTNKSSFTTTIKGLLLSSSLLLASHGVNAQSTGSVRLNGKQGQGFIVMNQATTPYSCWRFAFSERTGKASLKYPNGVVPLDNITVCGKDYVKIPDAYRFSKTKDIIVSIYGITRGGSEVLVVNGFQTGTYTGPPKIGTDCPVYAERCGAVCDGNYQGQAYAYQYKVYEKIGGTGGSTHLKMETPTAGYIGNVPTPFYGFYSVASATEYINSRGITGTIGQYMQTYNGQASGISPMLHTDNLAPGVSINTPTGLPINGFYYMIPKDFGIWRNYKAYLSKPNYSITGGICESPSAINFYNNEMNNYINSIIPSTPQLAGWTNLGCYGEGWSISEGSDGWIDPCATEAYTILGDDNPDIINYLQVMFGCEYSSSTGNDWWGEWWEQLGYVEIVPISGTSTTPVWVHNGGPLVLGQSVTLKTGLYKIQTQAKDGRFVSLVFEAKQNITFTVQMKDLVSTVIFPVPIVENSFSINIETPIDVNFTYELWDNRGRQLVSQSVEVVRTEGEPFTVPISSSLPIPSGALVNKFIFSDGSMKIMNTVK